MNNSQRSFLETTITEEQYEHEDQGSQVMDQWLNKICDAIWEVAKNCNKKCETCKFRDRCIMDKTVGELVRGKKELEPMIDKILKPEPETCEGLEQLELFKVD